MGSFRLFNFNLTTTTSMFVNRTFPLSVSLKNKTRTNCRGREDGPLSTSSAYAVLGVQPDCSAAEIKAAFRSKVKQFHPDLNRDENETYSDVMIRRVIQASSFTFSVVTVFLATVILTVHGCSPSDRTALLSFKASLKEPYHGIFNTWSGENCCVNWYGVSCDSTTGRVTDINLRGESEDPIISKSGKSGYMTGKISPEICKIDSLTSFILADWKAISGEIPQCLTSLSNLRILDLIGNQLTGKIPVNIGKLQRLTVLNLAENSISGEIPTSVVELCSLKHLDLSSNSLTGSIPVNFGNLQMLSRALLNRNQLTGSIPVSVTKIYRLADLDLSMNRLTGSLPYELGKMPVLSTLNLDSNSLSGQIPSSLLSNSGLGILNLSRNGFSGTIPDVFCPNSYFMVLDMSFNNLNGRVPGSLSSAKYIGHLDLSHNHLCGSIPLGVGSPFDHLDATSFSNNDCLCGNPLKTC